MSWWWYSNPFGPGQIVTAQAKVSEDPQKGTAPAGRHRGLRAGRRAHGGARGSGAGYWTRSMIEKIGMYKATIMPPTTMPRKAIMSGSIKLVSWEVVDSTSAS